VRYLLDTNVISELVARQPDQSVLAWIEALDQTAVYLSVITIGEIHRGIERLGEVWRSDSTHRRWSDDGVVFFGSAAHR
jgi:toxin FitB